MKVKDLINMLSDRQRKSVEGCLERCDLLDPEEEIAKEIPQDVVEFSKIIANPIRASILKMLSNRWLCVCLIAKALDQDQTLISHHLRTLKRFNLLHEKREGKLRFYRTNREVLERYLEKLSLELLGGRS
ncbi:ArsR/SmtB family transcription factor [Thermococcus gammatolerans]|uniref:Transcription regulator, arsR family n=1 Tax=Thermococcus gammatolerans (strain DSM 15229 / JCM 11827 / EJ3) TaxID=593117 RepID=C5A3X7_THEGJ|nr:metalloregulator ArsR/SmtB family transcription factor [Thermococcus gammatolerans]ACS32939.1 Transcription regulator, arsR family [Thermococcus gammatolerans EJ3]